jgi:2-polyprenyl-3-methyl-5-hydroxy-6-metoxy-1,4-benzoquinol methylase
MLITEYYRQQNAELHEARKTYGSRVRSARYVEIAEIIQEGESILDYGCGKAEMSRHLKGVTNYDPALYPDLPWPHDIVVCMDVLEHIEPECLTDVLTHLHGLTKRVAYLVISRAKNGKRLPDGRFSHLIVRSPGWWELRLKGIFGQVMPIRSPADELHDMTFIAWP